MLEMTRELWLRSPAQPFGEWVQMTRSRGVGSRRLGSLPPRWTRRGNWYPRMLVAKATGAEDLRLYRHGGEGPICLSEYA